MRTEIIVPLSFLLVIIAGTLLLNLPFVEHREGLSFVDALFFATSAVCVTGLVPLATSDFNLAGQLVLLVLIQIGGIGIMVIASCLILILRGELNLQQLELAERISGGSSPIKVEGVLWTVLKFTIFCETVGCLLLLFFFHDQGMGMDWSSSAYQALFHSISAFCNAGFSTFADSLSGLSDFVKITVSLLIISGGVGYLVIYDAANWFRKHRNVTLHSKIVLSGSIFLLVIGTLLLVIFEGTDISLVDAFFQSATARTAGFNTVVINSLSAGSVFLLMVLMVVGAAPGSTGGGVKVTSAFITLLASWHIIKGNKEIQLWGRTISTENVLRAMSLLFVYLLFLAVGILLLLFVEDLPAAAVVFEGISAMGTVGLSLGITGKLSTLGKMIIIVLMYIGRIGPALLMLSVFMKRGRASISYPEEQVWLG